MATVPGKAQVPTAPRKVAIPDARAGAGGPARGDARAPSEAPRPVQEPVWLVRAVIVLFLLGFAAFLAREVRNLLAVLD